MSNDINQIVSEKLDKNNFHAWKFRMTTFLMGKGFWDYVEGENEDLPELPEENATTVERHSRIGTRVHARSCIGCLSVLQTL